MINVRFLVVLKLLMMALMLLCIMWDSHTDVMKQPCLAVKACQYSNKLIVLYMRHSLNHCIDVLDFLMNYIK